MHRRPGMFAFVVLCCCAREWMFRVLGPGDTATLSGAITDPQGLAVAGAKITVTSSGDQRGTTSPLR